MVEIQVIESRRGKGNCLAYHIGLVAGQKRVFKIADMIPVIEKYIAGEFTLGGIHYVVGDVKLIKEISRKSRNFLKQLELGRMHSQVDALKIRDELLADNLHNKKTGHKDDC